VYTPDTPILTFLLDPVDQRVSSHPRCIIQHIFREQRRLELGPSQLGVLDLDDALTDLWFYHMLETSYLGLILNVSLLHLVLIRGKELRDILAIKSASNLNRPINYFVDQRLSISCFQHELHDLHHAFRHLLSMRNACRTTYSSHLRTRYPRAASFHVGFTKDVGIN
jgi:hypothetical protein